MGKFARSGLGSALVMGCYYSSSGLKDSTISFYLPQNLQTRQGVHDNLAATMESEQESGISIGGEEETMLASATLSRDRSDLILLLLLLCHFVL